ncbi:HlyD family efflux transporter periplasmic adaptor subunit [Allochromatium humboldtianum]|uniref:HlyD family efflux transporter periplasmic adaptor subunit n=1 Tax=Allochromatium humboldtianum TaxID=504901 RepID=A0A850RF65_9GAMM|nr:HlyD family efflux transporter periplasmic adaptor subunit [Allochromatium humboldtianum]NVZ09822.1 HlyD family efflux transporter periplasmic adaptor subunit [Allochromatium humboldtianum]
MPRRILPILILALGVGIFVALKATRPAPHPVQPSERIWRIAVTDVRPAAHHPILTLFGQVEAPDRIQAAAPVAGRLLEVQVRDGERVAAGALLARLDPRDLQPRLTRAQADLEKERLKLVHDRQALEQEREILRLARQALERAETVQSKQLGSISSVDEAREQYARAQLAVTLREQSIAEHPARLATLEAALAEAERDLARGTIRAPFEARIGVVEAAAGDQLQPNQTILTLYPLDGLYVRAKVPGVHSEELRAALTNGEQLTASGSHAGRPVTAVLERLSGEADARGVDALLRLAPESRLPLGAFVELRLERPPAPDTIALPFAALHGGDRIFAVRDGRLHGLRIERVGELDTGAGEGRVLLRVPELQPGEPVMITHLPNALDTLKVEIVQ